MNFNLLKNKKMEVVHFIYNNQEVDFLPSGDENIMINATQMATIFGKRVDHFLRSDHAQAFIEALLLVPKSIENQNLFTPNGGNKFKYSRDEILKTNKRGGTWMHRILALKFAAWLDPAFEVWVFETVDQIILGHYKEQKEATTEKLMAEQQLEMKKRELLEKYPEFVDFLALEGKVSEAEKRGLKAIRESVKQLKLDLFPIMAS
jgi:hypothetical protein